MRIKASVTMIDGKPVPTVTVDDEVRYFEHPYSLPDHNRFIGEADALNYAMDMVSTLNKTVLYTLQEHGFIVDEST